MSIYDFPQKCDVAYQPEIKILLESCLASPYDMGATLKVQISNHVITFWFKVFGGDKVHEEYYLYFPLVVCVNIYQKVLHGDHHNQELDKYVYCLNYKHGKVFCFYDYITLR